MDKSYDSQLMPDYCAERGAHLLAHQIERYWRGRGYLGIAAEIERVDDAPVYSPSNPNFGPVFRVTTNIGANGYPPKHLNKSYDEKENVQAD